MPMADLKKVTLPPPTPTKKNVKFSKFENKKKRKKKVIGDSIKPEHYQDRSSLLGLCLISRSHIAATLRSPCQPSKSKKVIKLRHYRRLNPAIRKIIDYITTVLRCFYVKSADGSPPLRSHLDQYRPSGRS